MLNFFQMGLSIQETFLNLFVFLIALVFSFSIHEYMHAWMAYKCGDDTAKLKGRLTMRPLSHIDPIGFLMVFFVGFGWARPVPINPNKMTRFKNKNTSIRLVSLAGVSMNFLVCFVANLLLGFLTIFCLKTGRADILRYANPMTIPVMMSFLDVILLIAIGLLTYLTWLNLILMAFNLLPLPPLDGYRFLESFFPLPLKAKAQVYEKYAYTIFLILILIGYTTDISILGWIINKVTMPVEFILDNVTRFLFGIFL